MADDDLLSQEEKDALIKGVEQGDIDTASERTFTDEPQSYNFGARDGRIFSSLSRVDTINELLIETLTDALQRMFRSEPSISVQPIQTLSQPDFVDGLDALCCINVCQFDPLPGRFLLVIEAELLSLFVDRYFGGKGLATAGSRAKQFTSIEQKLADQVSKVILNELETAWADVLQVSASIELSEHNPDYLSIPITDEPAAHAVFEIGFTESKGQCHLVFPYSMFRPIKEKLVVAKSSLESFSRTNWTPAIEASLKQTMVELTASLGESTMTLGELLALRPGDTIGLKTPDDVVLKVQGIPLFAGKVGASSGHNAVKITDSELD